MLGPLRIIVPLVIIAVVVYLLVRAIDTQALLADRQRQREHERRMARDQREYDTLIESVQDQEFQEELHRDSPTGEVDPDLEPDLTIDDLDNDE